MRRALVLLPLLVLLGCRTSLFEQIDEDQANRIVAALSHHGIAGEKSRNPDGTWNISVEDHDAVVATELASAYALPRGGHANLGDLFSRQGLISSPEEDRVRFVYGLTQELSETLEKMDGVLVARVHIVLPEKTPLGPPPAEPSASVMIRYRSDYNLEQMRERIRTLVAGSVEGLTRERVDLVLVAVTPVLSFPGACTDADGDCAVNAPAVRARLPIVLCLIAIVALLVLPAAWLWHSGARSLTDLIARRRNRNRRAPQSEPGSTNSNKEIEPS
jgi:type III secretion protein J